jgi:hypothetical protein
LELVHILGGDAAVRGVFAGKRYGDLVLGPGAGSADGGEGAAEIVEGEGGGFSAVAGDELEAGVVEEDGSIAVIGEDDEDGKDGVPEHVGMEERGLLRGVIGVGGEGYLFIGVGIMEGEGAGWNQRGHGEVPGEGGEDERGQD